MNTIQQIVTVRKDGQVTLRVPWPAETRVRVIVLEESGTEQDEAIALACWQEQSGFARQVLADPAEDVWNAL
ncbi:MAG: hypothetical protein KDJ31_08695 [Candidatus Competibacteraceae bacterium]|nr:hypothetical protein [Candidatus Competibacteraceae bacterium]